MRSALLMALLVLVAGGCDAGASMGREPDEFAGCATDEGWPIFDDLDLSGRISAVDAQAPAFLPPVADGATFTIAAKPTFAWQITPSLAGRPSGTAACQKCSLCGMHEPAVSGDVYDLRFTVDGKVSYRVMTTLQAWTPPDATWSGWRGKTVSLDAVHALLKVNEVDGAATRASRPLQFTVKD